MSALSIRSVRKTYSHGPDILKGIDIEIDDGQFLILVGPSGCGKSTLLNMIAGLESISSGDILIGDTCVNSLAPKDRDIAMVFQSYALYPSMSVRKNISFGLEIRKRPRAEIDATVARVTEILQLGPLLDRKPAQLSGGQRQRVAMGRALARNPAIFLFDEPLSNLDAKLRVEMRLEIKQMHQRLGATIVYVTHDQIEAMTMGDRIAVMRDGVVQQFGAPQEIYDTPANLFVAAFMGSPGMNFIPVELGVQGEAVTCRIQPKGKPAVVWVLPQRPADVADNLGRRILLGVRPEQITDRRTAHRTDLPSLMAEVDLTEPTGADTLVSIEINGVKTCCRVHPGEAALPGQPMPFIVDLSKSLLFDPDSGRRIA